MAYSPKGRGQIVAIWVFPILVFASALFATGIADIPGKSIRAEGVSAYELPVLRSAAVGVFFLSAAGIRLLFAGWPAIDKHAWRAVLTFAVLGVMVTNGGTTVSMSILPSSIAMPVIFATSVVVAIAIGLFESRRGAIVHIGVGIVLAGLVFVLARVGDESRTDDFTWLALCAPVVTGLAQGSMYKFLGNAKTLDGFTYFALGFGIAGAVLAAVGVLSGVADFQSLRQAGGLSLDGYCNLFLLAVPLTAMPYLAARYVSDQITMIAKGAASSTEPLGGVVADAYNRDEKIPEAQLALVAVIIAVVLCHLVYQRIALKVR